MPQRVFPNLAATGFEHTSPQTPSYNCIAWAAGDNTRWWWPDPFMQAYWPHGVMRAETLDAFVAAYQTLGYEVCEDGEPVVNAEKIALYALNGSPTHAARMLPDGMWTSKLGKGIDISHTLEGLVGDVYGGVVLFMERNR